MSNERITITVGVDFTGVVHIPSPGPGIDESWSKPPTWTVKQEVVITGPTDITWKLVATNPPDGLSAIFANGDTSLDKEHYDRVNPIQFLNPDPPGPMLWPYQQPTRQPDGLHVTVTDPFTPDPKNPNGNGYEYYIWVVLADATGIHKAPAFSKDPDIKNDGGKKKYTIAHSAS